MFYSCINLSTAQVVIGNPEKQKLASPEDTMYIQSFIRAAEQFIPLEIDSAIAHLKQARDKSIAAAYPDGAAKALMQLSFLYYMYKGDIVTANYMLNAAKPYCANAIFEKEALEVTWMLIKGGALGFSGKFDSAVHYYNSAFEMAVNAKDTISMILAKNNIAAFWQSNGKPQNAINSLTIAEHLSLQSEGTPYLEAISLNFAKVYRDGGDTMKWRQYAEQTLHLAEKTKYIRSQSAALMLLGGYYDETKDYVKAIDYYHRSLSLSDKMTPVFSTEALTGLSRCYYNLKNYNKAKETGLRAHKIIQSTGFVTGFVLSLYSHLAKMHYALGETEAAYQYQVQYSKFSDSLNNAERNKAADKLEAQYRTAEKDKQLLMQQAQVRNRNVWIAISGAGSVIVILISILLYRNSRRKIYILKQQREIHELKAMMNGEEKERSRMAKELHDGVGGLLSAAAINLDMLADNHSDLQEDPAFQKTETLINEISKEVRKTAQNLMPDVLLYNSLEDAIKLFCSSIRKGKDISIEVWASGNFSTLSEDLLLSSYRIVQELIQNIVKHAQATEVLVQLQKSSELLSITVEDNGIGYVEKEIDHGMGLRNIRDRVKSHQGRLSIDSTEGKGTSVYVEFDIVDNG